jgi:hypothetical protein
MVIQRLTLYSSRIQELFQFYGTILELPLIQAGQGLSISVGSSELVFKPSQDGSDPFYHFAFNIPSNKIEESRKWMEKKAGLIWLDDYKSDIADFVNWHAKSIYFFDPAGNIVEFIARMDLDNEAIEGFSEKQILSISEAGLVFPVPLMSDKTDDIITKYQLSYFDKQPPLPQFKAIGDDEGLFIIVPENRNWYPTQKPSGIFPMEIDFEQSGARYHLGLA